VRVGFSFLSIGCENVRLYLCSVVHNVVLVLALVVSCDESACVGVRWCLQNNVQDSLRCTIGYEVSVCPFSEKPREQIRRFARGFLWVRVIVFVVSRDRDCV